MIEFGRMLMVQQMLTNAAREGARVAVLDGASASATTTKVVEYLASIDQSAVEVTTTPSNLGSVDTGDPVAVQVTVPYEEVSWLPSPWFLDNRELTASCTMRRE